MQKAFVENASDEAQVREANKKEKFGRKEELSDVYFILSTVQGRRFFWRYLSACGIFRTSFTGNSETYFLEGKRSTGLMLLADINEADPDSYLKMIKENN